MELEQKQQSPTWMGCAEGAWVGMGIGMGGCGSWGCAEWWDIMGCVVVSAQNLLHRHQFPPGGSVPSQHRRQGEPQLLLRAGETGEGNLGEIWGVWKEMALPRYRSALLGLKLIFYGLAMLLMSCSV